MTGDRVERWGVFELCLRGPSEANSFTAVRLGCRFSGGGRQIDVKGFPDGGDCYRVRFMPEQTGAWTYRTSSNRAELDGVEGAFDCVSPSAGNHGPVRVSGSHHFRYADGTPFFVMGTTAYAWTYRPEEVRRRTLESFSRHGFNKIRMLFFPKHYGDGRTVDVSYDPPTLPFPAGKNGLDFSSFEVAYFQEFETRIRELQERGIEADVILFHFYDFGHWDIDRGLGGEEAIFFLDYLVARLGAFRNIWWSLANEYDLRVDPASGELHCDADRRDWDAIGSFLQKHDPFNHLRSVHNFPYGRLFPDRPWLTHVSYQSANTYSLLMDLKRTYGKPVIDDEYQYEGNIPDEWDNCTPELELTRHWMATMAGGYATHGEAYRMNGNSRDIFWSYGGDLHGGSPPRLKFMREILESCPFQEMEPDVARSEGRDMFCLRKAPDVYLYFMTPAFKDKGRLFVGPPEGTDGEYEATIYDAWNCWIHSRCTVKSGMQELDMPPWAAITLVRK